jgi:CubicO group peptidase (beta-lactamase class C family)
MAKRLSVLLSLLILLSLDSFSQTLNTKKLDSFFNTLDQRGLANGSIAISINGKIQYQKAVGYSFIEGDKKIQADIFSKYRIGSATKMFTAVMIFQLVEEGKIIVDQKLAAYFPDLPNADKITIGNMLYHRSGLHDYTHDTNFEAWMDSSKTHSDLLRIIREKGSDFEPGTQADYCNSNYLLLGYIIEKLCQMPYAEAVQKRIISKLHLKNTYCGKPINTKDKECTSYKYADGSWIKQKETNLSIHGGAGSLVSNPADMVRFIYALFSGELVSKSSLSKMETMIDGYGMGMFPDKYGSRQSFGHNGRIEEFYSAAWYFPSEKLSIAYCTNGIDYPRTDIIEGALKICFNEPFELPFFRAIRFSSVDLDKYLGKYSNGQIRVNCTKDGTKLLLETKGKVFELEPIAENYFMHARTGYFFEFDPEKSTLEIKETDNVYHLKREN